ncbi:MAG: TetR family transcriptional regulator [bacterium]
MSKIKHDDNESTKNLLINKATALFAQKGFEGTTIKDISDATGVNVSLVSYHFGGKEGLYYACLEQFGKERLAVVEKILLYPKSKEEFEIRLQMFLDELIDVHLEKPDITELLHREFDSKRPKTMEIFKNTFLRSYKLLLDFFAAAQKQKIIRQDINASMVGALMFGGMKVMLMHNHIQSAMPEVNLDDFSIKSKIRENYMKLFLDGLYGTIKR